MRKILIASLMLMFLHDHAVMTSDIEQPTPATGSTATCHGDDPCRACKDCSKCKLCSNKNGSCGVCRK